MPYRRQCEKFTPYNKQRYHNISAKANKVVILKENYADGCFLQRNDYILSCSGHLIAYFDGVPKGSTYYTFKRAKQQAARYVGCQSVLINEISVIQNSDICCLVVCSQIASYYLGFGNRNQSRLWAGKEEKQIEYMKRIYESFSDGDKPNGSL